MVTIPTKLSLIFLVDGHQVTPLYLLPFRDALEEEMAIYTHPRHVLIQKLCDREPGLTV